MGAPLLTEEGCIWHLRSGGCPCHLSHPRRQISCTAPRHCGVANAKRARTDAHPAELCWPLPEIRTSPYLTAFIYHRAVRLGLDDWVLAAFARSSTNMPDGFNVAGGRSFNSGFGVPRGRKVGPSTKGPVTNSVALGDLGLYGHSTLFSVRLLRT